jgi:hypothetical protein
MLDECNDIFVESGIIFQVESVLYEGTTRCTIMAIKHKMVEA